MTTSSERSRRSGPAWRTPLSTILCAVALASCSTTTGGLPEIAVANVGSRLGGEALAFGRIKVSGRCVFLSGGPSQRIPIFDQGVEVTTRVGQDGLLDTNSGTFIPFGSKVSAGGAFITLGQGWSLKDAQRFISRQIDPRCGKQIVRLENLKLIP